MWTCPKCGREFKNTDQSHYCGSAPKTIDQYIEGQPEERQPYLAAVRETIRSAIPEAEERISWSMPTWWRGKNLIHFAANKKHIGLYPGDEAVLHFAPELAGYKFSKGSIQIPYSSELPLELIGRIARWCFENSVGEG